MQKGPRKEFLWGLVVVAAVVVIGVPAALRYVMPSHPVECVVVGMGVAVVLVSALLAAR